MMDKRRRGSPLSRHLAAEFEAAPWLLPTRTPLLPYAGVHGFDKLLRLRASAIGGYDGAVALMHFTKADAVVAQNSSEWQRPSRNARKTSPSLVPPSFRRAAAVMLELSAPPSPPPLQSTPWSSTAACATT
jgi:hypothetical protein